MAAVPVPAGAVPPAADVPDAKARDESGGRAKKAQDDSASGVEKVRAWAGLIAVVVGDAAIATAAILGITQFTHGTSAQVLPQVVAILSGAFTAIGTMTTAYFGIKAMSNTAKNLVASK